MFGRLSDLHATPEEICSKLPEPSRPGCVRRMSEMFRAARHERRMGALEIAGIAVAAVVGGIALYVVAKGSGLFGETERAGCQWPLISYGPPSALSDDVMDV